MSDKKPTYPEIYAVIMKNMKLLRKAGVLTARPGYEITGGKVTYKPAIVVTVTRKKKGLRPQDKLPAEIGDIPVDIREATPMQLLRDKDPDAFHIIQALGPRELNEPESKWECSMRTGKPVAGPSPQVKALVTPAKHKKTLIPYTPALNAPLNPVTGKITITAYASPDDGYTVLSSYLKNTKSNMTVAMYDFTSGDLLKDVISTLKGKLPFKMVLDHPSLNPTHNQSDPQTHDAILKSDPEAAINWALDNMSPNVTADIYPSAYHIKVVVRDKTTFWLSSGNFNVSNQPNLAVDIPSRGSLKTADRDWHVIVEHKGLANLFEEYILHDFEVAAGHQAANADTAATKQKLAIAKAQRRGLDTSLKKLAAVAKTVRTKSTGGFPTHPSTLGKNKVFTNAQVTIQPLLTPDKVKNTPMYIDNVLKLIQSAEKTIYVQMQYITPPKTANSFSLLIDALGEAFARGLDVRIIIGNHQKDIATEALSVPKLKLDQVMRKMTNVHNKGIVVDSTKILVSSQNWSGEGVMSNRDAGLIIDNAEIAAYFEEIFNDDWAHRATSVLSS